jgi:hypothetical protein
MLLIVDHLTRMKLPYICVAGLAINPSIGHVRPVLGFSNLDRPMLLREGGPFDIGAIVHLGEVEYDGSEPEVEDHLFFLRNASYIENLNSAEFWQALDGFAKPSLHEIFGPDILVDGERMTLPLGHGIASLGCLRPAHRPALFISRRGRVRARLHDDGQDLNLSVTDLRLYEEDQATPKREMVNHVMKEMAGDCEVILSVGLTRPFQGPGRPAAEHWLQVNNLHLSTHPVCQDAPKRGRRPSSFSPGKPRLALVGSPGAK